MELRNYQESVNRKYREDQVIKDNKRTFIISLFSLIIAFLALIVSLISLIK